MTIIDRLALALERRIDRRGFLARTALGSTALAAAPAAYALKPVDAYAAICNCSGSNCDCNSACCDGYTEFCCTLYGLNRCPPGSVIAGWWKVDASNFCGGAARYYMDCNAGCGSCGCGAGGVCAGACGGVGCGCAFGDCSKRRAGCVAFRYGQCNQQVQCVGPIICRLVSCIPPWQIDATCTTTVAVDEATRFHTGPCLHAGRGHIDTVTREPRQVRLQGWALDPNSAAALELRVLVNGRFVTTVTANRERGDLVPYFPGVGPNHGFDFTLPLPAGTHTIELFGVQAFPAADIVRLATTVVGVGSPFGSFDVVAQAVGGVRVSGWMIDPTSDEAGLVHVYANGRLVGALPADRERSDVGAAYPAFGSARGFDGVVEIGADGPQTICVYGFAQGNPAASQLLACKTITLRSTPVGSLDRVTRVPGGVRVTGWAIDPDVRDPIEVHVYVNGALAQVASADRERSDVGALYPTYGERHGYDVTVPSVPGRNDVCVYAINQKAGSNPLLGCASLSVSSIPFGAIDMVSRVEPGRVRVAGWTIDPDTTAPIPVHVYADGGFVGEFMANKSRSDVGALYPAWGDAHGFDEVVTVGSARSVCIYPINVGPGSNPLLGCRAPQ